MWLPLILTALILAVSTDIWPKNSGFLSGIQQLTIIILAGWALSLIWTAQITRWLTC